MPSPTAAFSWGVTAARSCDSAGGRAGDTAGLGMDPGSLGMHDRGLEMDPRGLGVDSGGQDGHWGSEAGQWRSGNGCWGSGDGPQRSGDGHGGLGGAPGIWRWMLGVWGRTPEVWEWTLEVCGQTPGVWGHRRSGLAPSLCCVSPVAWVPPCPVSCPSSRFWDAQENPHLAACACPTPSKGMWIHSRILGRILEPAGWLGGSCAWWCPVPRDVLRGPLPFPGSPELPRERGSLAVGGAAGSVPATCSAAVPVTALRFLGFFAPSCCMIPLESQRDHGVWVQDRDEEQEFSSRSCQDF